MSTYKMTFEIEANEMNEDYVVEFQRDIVDHIHEHYGREFEVIDYEMELIP